MVIITVRVLVSLLVTGPGPSSVEQFGIILRLTLAPCTFLEDIQKQVWFFDSPFSRAAKIRVLFQALRGPKM